MLRRAVNTILLNPVTQKMKSKPMSAVTKENWDLYAGVLVERLPVITKPLSGIEVEFQVRPNVIVLNENYELKIIHNTSFICPLKEHLNQIEFEQSLKSDFELRHEKELIIANLQKKGAVDIEIIESVQQTAQDLTDAWKEEYKSYQLANRITDDDQKKNIKSVNRKLDKTLWLLIEQQIGNRKYMLLPQGKREPGENLRQTAERTLKMYCGDNLNVLFYGNAPCGFYKYKYPIEERRKSDAVGAKIFFFRSTYQSGFIDDIKMKSLKYEWQDDEGLMGKLNGNYMKSVSQFLIL